MSSRRPGLVLIAALAVGCSGPAPDDDAPVDSPAKDDTPDPVVDTEPAEQPDGPATVAADDLAADVGLDDFSFGHWKRGRACSLQDFDGDGRIDAYVGNPGDESYILLNRPTQSGFELVPDKVLSPDGFFWSVSSADYDNDGDVDVFLNGGGNETVAINRLLRNDLVETGEFDLVDVGRQARVEGLFDDGDPRPQGHGGGNWVDIDNDGDLDLFVAVNYFPLKRFGSRTHPPDTARNLMFQNNGDGTFSERGRAVGMDSQFPSRHAAWLDIDNDGDLDAYESNCGVPNILWRNLLVEEGTVRFEDVTDELSLHGSLGMPVRSFAAAVADVNQDGFEDLLAFWRDKHCDWPEADIPADDLGHRLYLNVGGTGFADVSDLTVLNDTLPEPFGVMGVQVADVDANGFADVYVGNGGPSSGVADQLFLNDGPSGVEVGTLGVLQVPIFVDRTALIDVPAPEVIGRDYPPYPHRTHGTCVADVDGDGPLEILVTNGGMWNGSDVVAEPNRLFKLIREPTPHWLHVDVEGDGVHVNRDGIGARLRVTVSEGADGDRRTLHATRRGNNGFSADVGPTVFFGLDQHDTIHELHVTWPDGTEQTVTTDLAVDTTVVVSR